jgi:hypothetical protein
MLWRAPCQVDLFMAYSRTLVSLVRQSNDLDSEGAVKSLAIRTDVEPDHLVHGQLPANSTGAESAKQKNGPR